MNLDAQPVEPLTSPEDQLRMYEQALTRLKAEQQVMVAEHAQNVKKLEDLNTLIIQVTQQLTDSK